MLQGRGTHHNLIGGSRRVLPRSQIARESSQALELQQAQEEQAPLTNQGGNQNYLDGIVDLGLLLQISKDQELWVGVVGDRGEGSFSSMVERECVKA